MKKTIITIAILTSVSLTACSNEEEVVAEPVIEEVETSEEDALADAIENAESAADAMGKEISDATSPEVALPAPVDDNGDNAE